MSSSIILPFTLKALHRWSQQIPSINHQLEYTILEFMFPAWSFFLNSSIIILTSVPFRWKRRICYREQTHKLIVLLKCDEGSFSSHFQRIKIGCYDSFALLATWPRKCTCALCHHFSSHFQRTKIGCYDPFTLLAVRLRKFTWLLCLVISTMGMMAVST